MIQSKPETTPATAGAGLMAVCVALLVLVAGMSDCERCKPEPEPVRVHEATK
jgi:hypothetical protein